MAHRHLLAGLAAASLALSTGLPAQARNAPAGPTGRLVHVTLDYRRPVAGQPRPRFSPKGTQAALADIPSKATLPPGAMRPARTGVMKVGSDSTSWMSVMVTATREFPKDLCQLFVDRNRNGDFADDGPAVTPVTKEADWCGPCKTMDEWVWTDAEVAAALNDGYIGVKLDGDVETALVERFAVIGYPTMIVLDGAGHESWRTVGCQSSAGMLALLKGRQ